MAEDHRDHQGHGQASEHPAVHTEFKACAEEHAMYDPVGSEENHAADCCGHEVLNLIEAVWKNVGLARRNLQPDQDGAGRNQIDNVMDQLGKDGQTPGRPRSCEKRNEHEAGRYRIPCPRIALITVGAAPIGCR